MWEYQADLSPFARTSLRESDLEDLAAGMVEAYLQQMGLPPLGATAIETIEDGHAEGNIFFAVKQGQFPTHHRWKSDYMLEGYFADADGSSVRISIFPDGVCFRYRDKGIVRDGMPTYAREQAYVQIEARGQKAMALRKRRIARKAKALDRK